MQQTERKDIQFKSADGKTQIAAYFYENTQVKPRCVLQISHGMCEYIQRYAHFAQHMAANAVAVCGSDHLGHGNSIQSENDLGFFSEKGGRRFVLQDLKSMNSLVKARYPDLPHILLGHSMGSFFARQYAVSYPGSINALILSGTAGHSPATKGGMAMASSLAVLKGQRYRSALMYKLAFGQYQKRIPSPKTPYDWLSTDEQVVSAYAKDPKCTFRFTLNGYQELLHTLDGVSSPGWAAALPKSLPIMMLQGDEDPVGGYGRGTAQVAAWLRGAGAKLQQYKLYAGGRHEMLNSPQREEVYADILAFIWQSLGG